MRKIQVTLLIALGGAILWQIAKSPTYPSLNTSVGTAAAPSVSCTASDFSVSKLRENTEYDTAKLTGIVTSHCASAAGVQLKWTAFNADGTVAFFIGFLASEHHKHSATHGFHAFEMVESAPRGKWTYRVEAINVDVW